MIKRRPAARRPGACVVAVLAVLLLAGGCGSGATIGGTASGQAVAVPDEPEQITILADLDANGMRALRYLARSFERSADRDVEVHVARPEDYGVQPDAGPPQAQRMVNAVEVAVASAAPPELALLETPEAVAQLNRDGYLLPLPASAVQALATNQVEAAARVAAGGDAPVGLPLSLDVEVLYSHRGFVFSVPDSWQEITGIAAVTAAANAQANRTLTPGIVVGPADAGVVAAMARAAQAGAGAGQGKGGAGAGKGQGKSGAVHKAGKGNRTGAAGAQGADAAAPVATLIGGAAAFDAADQAAAWFQDGDLWLSPHPLQAFLTGQAGMVLAHAGDVGRIEEALGGHTAFSVSALPYSPVRVELMSPLHYGTPSQRAVAAEFLAFLAGGQPQAFWALQRGRLPAVAQAFATSTWQEYVGQHSEVGAMASRLDTAVAWPPDAAASAWQQAQALWTIALAAAPSARP